MQVTEMHVGCLSGTTLGNLDCFTPYLIELSPTESCIDSCCLAGIYGAGRPLAGCEFRNRQR